MKISQLQILEHKNWGRLCVQIKVLLKFQGALDIMMSDCEKVSEDSSVVEIATHTKNEKKDYETLFLLHQSVDTTNIEKITTTTTVKEAWKILEKCHEGAKKVKVNLKTMRRQCELL